MMLGVLKLARRKQPWRIRTFTTQVIGAHAVDVDKSSKTIQFVPTGQHTASVVIIHGLGDTAFGWADPVVSWMGSLPHVKFILPTAPEQPVTLNMGHAMPSWYDIKGLGERSDETCDGIEDSRKVTGSNLSAGLTEAVTLTVRSSVTWFPRRSRQESHTIALSSEA